MNTLLEQFNNHIRDELQYSTNTVSAYMADLRDWARFATGNADGDGLDPMSVTRGDIRAWVSHISRRGTSPRTVRRKISSLRAFYGYLMKFHGLAASPAEDIPMPKVSKDIPVYVRPEETRAILDADVAEDSFEGVRNRLIMDMFYTTGIRCSELMGLREADVDVARGELKVLGKRNKERVVPFGSELGGAIESYRRLRDASEATRISAKDPQAPFFVREDGRPLYRKLIYNVVHSGLEAGGAHAARLSPHVLRHSCATDMLNGGAPIASVREMLGHASLASTQVYTHVTYKDLLNNYQSAHPRALKKGG
ncbi:MAG: tyrosine-type recombinase/integrase [Duncaniella sp.]|nr:tyrosine-type recombinase/integrase [Duncaniella sp.]